MPLADACVWPGGCGLYSAWDASRLRQQQVEEHSEDDAHQLAALHEDGSLVVDQRPVHVRVPLRPEEGEVAARNSEDGPL